MNEYLRYVRDMDSRTRDTVMSNHAKEFAVVDSALNRILGGVSDFADQKQNTDSRLESARLVLVVRSVNSLNCAMQLLQQGYSQQALALVRMAQEDQRVADDIEQNPVALDALLEGNGKLGKGDLSYSKMAERVSTGAKAVWDDEYGATSAFGAHPRPESMFDMLSRGDDGKGHLGVGGRYDEQTVNLVLCLATRQIVFAFGLLAKVVQLAGVEWEDPVPAFEAVKGLWQDIDHWASDRLATTEVE